ncbi:MAG TPA: sensor histidine kinase [Azospirillum sp.]|nr:sensor histidine kinase [Azospirillum sp.]
MWRELLRRAGAPFPFPVAAPAGTAGSAWALACAAAGDNGDESETAALRARVAALEAELGRAELLLRETNHRAKNAFATIASLVAIQMADVRDPQAREVLQLTQERLSAVALVHQALQGRSEDAVLDLGALLQRLGGAVAFSMGAEERGIEVRIAAQPVPVEAGAAVTLALIANELLTNALKYAFAGRSEGCVDLTLRRRAGRLLLRVQDNGVGAAPAPGRRGTGGTGLTLVRRLAEQVGARLRFGSRGGTSVTVSIPCRAL